ncbi:hypothetical protein PGAL8A_00444100 [Plasmodium gallinaceum]|uniref:Uncharacterized protein n=1 Tax=Plasmodium gallinaceum TaxID=5849 RepID=A0A1J1GWP1_PLAGA|nr:hypothetical protein PGAL8A_00444100 [Plasmodium gallinaceum]CRG96860.1 hypothetical protein PGAL8A_00444100 [Plasmodium gallinaceum]
MSAQECKIKLLKYKNMELESKIALLKNDFKLIINEVLNLKNFINEKNERAKDKLRKIKMIVNILKRERQYLYITNKKYSKEIKYLYKKNSILQRIFDIDKIKKIYKPIRLHKKEKKKISKYSNLKLYKMDNRNRNKILFKKKDIIFRKKKAYLSKEHIINIPKNPPLKNRSYGIKCKKNIKKKKIGKYIILKNKKDVYNLEYLKKKKELKKKFRINKFYGKHYCIYFTVNVFIIKKNISLKKRIYSFLHLSRVCFLKDINKNDNKNIFDKEIISLNNRKNKFRENAMYIKELKKKEEKKKILIDNLKEIQVIEEGKIICFNNNEDNKNLENISLKRDKYKSKSYIFINENEEKKRNEIHDIYDKKACIFDQINEKDIFMNKSEEFSQGKSNPYFNSILENENNYFAKFYKERYIKYLYNMKKDNINKIKEYINKFFINTFQNQNEHLINRNQTIKQIFYDFISVLFKLFEENIVEKNKFLNDLEMRINNIIIFSNNILTYINEISINIIKHKVSFESIIVALQNIIKECQYK